MAPHQAGRPVRHRHDRPDPRARPQWSGPASGRGPRPVQEGPTSPTYHTLKHEEPVSTVDICITVARPKAVVNQLVSLGMRLHQERSNSWPTRGEGLDNDSRVLHCHQHTLCTTKIAQPYLPDRQKSHSASSRRPKKDYVYAHSVTYDNFHVAYSESHCREDHTTVDVLQ